MTADTSSLSVLETADGSAQYSSNDYIVVGAINGPIEVQRRDEQAEEATIEVIVRPDIGTPTILERHLGDLLEKAVRSVILIHAYPRTLIQMTLQIIQKPSSQVSWSSSSYVAVLEPLLQTAMLTLLSGSIRLSSTFAAVCLAESDGQLVRPGQTALKRATSIHTIAFTGTGEMLLAESEGTFTIETWNAVAARAKELCFAGQTPDASQMEIEGANSEESLNGWLRTTVSNAIKSNQAWKT